MRNRNDVYYMFPGLFRCCYVFCLWFCCSYIVFVTFFAYVGLVFLQYRHETKRALLPNEITTLDTVRALFVRSFPRQLSMEYFDSHDVRIYIHDSNQDMFYELEDLRYEIPYRFIYRLIYMTYNPDIYYIYYTYVKNYILILLSSIHVMLCFTHSKTIESRILG